MSNLPVPTPMRMQEILALFPTYQHVDVSPSDNETTYVEWETGMAFASLEVGTDCFAFSLIPNNKSLPGSGRAGSLAQGALLASLIAASFSPDRPAMSMPPGSVPNHG